MQAAFPNLTQFDAVSGQIDGAPLLERRLSDLAGYFADPIAYATALAAADSLLYTVASIEPAHGDGALHYGITCLFPGRVGDEYYMTKGHFHAWRPAAEYYIGLHGTGLVLLEDEQGTAWTAALTPDSGVYIPGHTAHRTVNIGSEPLTFLGIYPSAAGHDYGSIVQRNFRQVVVAVARQPTVMERSDYLQLLK